MERIVVGIDGSHGSRRALDWAIDEARLRRAEVEAVHAWQVPYLAAYPYAVSTFDPEAYETSARTLLDTTVDGADTKGLPAPVTRLLVPGHPGSALVETAKGADLVVVGSRGLGGFRGALLGSVSHHLVHHAPCPVVVVPSDE